MALRVLFILGYIGIALSTAGSSRLRYRPVVLIPGLFCGDEGGIPEIHGWLQAAYPGIYVYNYTISHWESLLTELNVQVEMLATGVAKVKRTFDLMSGGGGRRSFALLGPESSKRL